MLKILVTDGLAKEAIAELKTFADVDEQFYEEDQLGAALANYDGLVIRSATKVRDY